MRQKRKNRAMRLAVSVFPLKKKEKKMHFRTLRSVLIFNMKILEQMPLGMYNWFFEICIQVRGKKDKKPEHEREKPTLGRTGKDGWGSRAPWLRTTSRARGRLSSPRKSEEGALASLIFRGR